MAYELPIMQLSLPAGANLSEKQFYAVKLNASGAIVLAGAGESGVGVLQDAPAAGEVGTVGVLGIFKAKAGGSITAGNNVTPDGSGLFVNASGSDAIWGMAMTSADSGDIFPVLMVCRTSTGTNSGVVLSMPINLPDLANGDVVTGMIPGIPGEIKKVYFVVTDAVTTENKAATLNLEIGTTNLSGGVLALTSANCTPAGTVINATSITGNNVLAADSAISIEASSVTTFLEGAGVLFIVIQ